MSSSLDAVRNDLKAAMKAGDKERVATLRLLLSNAKNEQIAIHGELDEAAFLKLVRKAIKQRNDSAAVYREGGREELAAKEEREAEILGAYVPPEVDDDEIRAAIRALIDEQGLSGPSAIGPIMKEMLAKFAGRADGGKINRLAREILAQ
jgi:uncharacterized protein YqeY